ncbi:MAG: NrfD/PsrC family molybdoenzyme membrane anchor subunit, partial [Planctomycetaceae bacterium]
ELIAAYFFVGGLAGGAQIIAAVADLAGDEEDRSVVRHGRSLALAGSFISPVLLIADLQVPRRWHHMLRMLRTTSPMSIGAWTLAAFGTLSGLAAAVQFLEDATGSRRLRPLARLFGLPAAATAGVLTTYTGTLLASTSTPLWSAGGRLLAMLFGTSAMSTATAALLIGEQALGHERSVRKLEHLGLAAGAVELITTAALERQWRDAEVDGPLQEEPARTQWRGGFGVLGVLAPLVLHGTASLMRRPSTAASLTGAVATLAGGYVLRHVLVSAGNRSARRPRDYFRLTQPHP